MESDITDVLDNRLVFRCAMDSGSDVCVAATAVGCIWGSFRPEVTGLFERSGLGSMEFEDGV